MSKIIYTTENENERPKQTNADTAPPLNLVYGQEDTNTRPKRRTVLQHYLEENSFTFMIRKAEKLLQKL